MRLRNPPGRNTDWLMCLMAACAFALAPEVLAAQASSTLDVSAIDAVFAAYNRSDTPGCAVGVVHEGALVYGRGYGMANLELGVAISPQTVFRTGSVGKQFTAAAVAMAARDGQISLDDPVPISNPWTSSPRRTRRC